METITVDRVIAATRTKCRLRLTCCVGLLVVGSLTAACSSAGSSGAADTSGSSTAGQTMIRDGKVTVAGPVPKARLQAVGSYAAQAISQVRQVWGSTVLRGAVVIEVPKDEAGFRALGGSADNGAEIAATTTKDDRVVLAPRLFTDVTDQGRIAVLTHELTHVALHQATLTGVERWVIEGSAEYTAYRTSGLSLAQLAPDIATAARSGHGPTGPPSDAEFARDPAAAYQSAYVWCVFLVDRFGQRKFTTFVRAADAKRPDAFVDVFGTSVAALRQPYASFLHSEFATGSTVSPSGAR